MEFGTTESEGCEHKEFDKEQAGILVCKACGVVIEEYILVNDLFSAGHQEFKLNAFYERFRSLCGNLVNQEVRDISLDRIKTVLGQKPEWGHDKKAMQCAAACLYFVVKEHGIAVFLNEILDAFQLDRSQFGKMAREVHMLIPLPQKVTNIRIFFPRFEALYLADFEGHQLSEMADRLLNFLNKNGFNIIYDPAVIAAAIVVVAVEILKGIKQPKYEVEIISLQAGTTLYRLQRRITQIHTRIRHFLKINGSNGKLRGNLYYKALYSTMQNL